MSVYTHFEMLNANCPKYLEALNNEEAMKDWIDEFGRDQPGSVIPQHLWKRPKQTGHEYGGYLIDVKSIPKEATHILVYRD